MIKISLWASRHIWTTRFIILIIYILLNGLALLLGDVLNASGIQLNSAFLLICVLLTLTGVFIYPTHNKKFSSKPLYRLHKTADIILGTATFLFVVFAGNQFSTTRIVNNNVNAAGIVTIVPVNTSTYSEPEPKASEKILPAPEKNKKLSFKQWKKQMRESIKEIRKLYRDENNGKRVALMTVSIVVAVILILALAALSCEIACSGAEALAAVLFIVGTTGIVFGLVRIIKSINKKYKKPKGTQEPATNT